MLTKLLGTCFFWAAWTVAFAVLIYKLRRKPKFLIPAIAIMLGIAAIPIIDKLYNPTALDQINPEMVWDVHAMALPSLKTYDFHGIYFAYDPATEPIGPGTRLAFMPSGFVDWPDAFLEASRNNVPPPPGAFLGMPSPRRAMHIDATGTLLVADPASSWDWADPSIKQANRHTASFIKTFRNLDWYEDTFRFRRMVNIKSKPDWWPTRGDVSKHHSYGRYVPGRPAAYRIVSCTYLWDADGGMIGGFGPGITTQVFTGPHELIIEDFSDPTPRRIGFRLLGQNAKSIGPMQVSQDGSVGYIPDNSSNLVWLIPLYKAWEYLDSTAPPTTPDSSLHNAQSPSRRAP